MTTSKEVNRGALFRAAHRLMVDAQTYIECAGNLTRLAGGTEEEILEVANAFLHAKRAIVKLAECAQLFPMREAVTPPPASDSAKAAS